MTKLYFKKKPNKIFKNQTFWAVLSKSKVCKDFKVDSDTAWSKRTTGDGEFSTHFEITYNEELEDIMLYCQPDYDEAELIGIRFCPWCGDKIEYEIT